MIFVVAQGMRDLFQDNDYSDAGEHSFNDRRGEVIGDETESEVPHQQLQNSGQYHGNKRWALETGLGSPHKEIMEDPEVVEFLRAKIANR